MELAAFPPNLFEVPDAASSDDDPLLKQESALCEEVAAVAAELSSRGNHAVTRD